MRYAYTLKNIESKEDGTFAVEFEYTLYNIVYNEKFPIFMAKEELTSQDQVAVKKAVLKYVDESIQNRISTKKDFIDKATIVDQLKNEYSFLIGTEINLTEDELEQTLDNLANQ